MQSLCWCARGSHVHQSQWNTECRAPVATPSAGVTYVSLSLSLSLYLYLSLSLSLSMRGDPEERAGRPADGSRAIGDQPSGRPRRRTQREIDQ